MVYETLGIDQTKPATGIADLFTDTDFDRARDQLSIVLYKNPAVNDIMKMAMPAQFLRDIISVMRELNLTLTPETYQTIQLRLLSRWPSRYTRLDYLDEYMNAFLQLSNDGLIPVSIMDPANYIPEPDKSIFETLTKNAALPFAGFALAAIAAYAFFSKGLPQLAAAK